MTVRMELSRILIRELNDYQIIELREAAGPGGGDAGNEAGGGRAFPIVIGLPEAQAIERRLKGVVVKRPQTHELLANVITTLGGTLKSVTINDLSQHTFYATLDVEHDGEMVHIDSRPSDAIALGVAGNVPIFVEESVLDAAMSEEA